MAVKPPCEEIPDRLPGGERRRSAVGSIAAVVSALSGVIRLVLDLK